MVHRQCTSFSYELLVSALLADNVHAVFKLAVHANTPRPFGVALAQISSMSDGNVLDST
jgi:hypothetical protein